MTLKTNNNKPFPYFEIKKENIIISFGLMENFKQMIIIPEMERQATVIFLDKYEVKDLIRRLSGIEALMS